MMHSGFPKQTVLSADGAATPVGYHSVASAGDCRVVSGEESLPPEQQQQQQQQQLLDLEYRLDPSGAPGDGGGGGGGRLVSFDSLGSLSVASSSYSSLSLHEGEGGGGEGEEGEMSDNFLSHCSPQLVLQQSLEEVTPLRESTDLLDISNFTPDKFRHASLSEMSPPETPSPSPHLIRQGGSGGGGFPAETGATELHWDCGVVSSSELEDVNGTRHTHLLQIHSFGPDEEDEEEGKGEEGLLKGPKGHKRKGGKSGPKKTKSSKTGKGEQTKSKSPRKIKAILEGTADKGMGGPQSGIGSPSAAMLGIAGEWPGVGSLSDDDQQEFKEPSNILSNIVSGMAEVQRFMRASVEPLWGPCPLPGEQSLQSQTLRILGGPFESGKKRGGGGVSGTGRGKKGAGRGAKNPPKLIPADFFPALGLDCFPVPHRPAHKKMYRHKSSAKFAREELALGKGSAKVSALTATLEKQR